MNYQPVLQNVLAISRNIEYFPDGFYRDMSIRIIFRIGENDYVTITPQEFNLYDEYGVKDENQFQFVFDVLKILNRYGMVFFRKEGGGFIVSFDSELIPPPSKPKKSGYVYLVKMSGTFLHKIGVTQDVKKRLQQLQTANPYPLELIASWESDDCMGLEERLHDMFFNKRASGEWFKLKDEDVFKAAAVMVLMRDA